jgi:hypothetical protein
MLDTELGVSMTAHRLGGVRSRRGLPVLIAFLALLLVGTALAVVQSVRDRGAPPAGFDVAGERADVDLDPLDPMSRPAAGEGVKLPPPQRSDDAESRGARGSSGVVEECGEASELDEWLGLGADEVCTAGAVAQAADVDALDAARFGVADGFEAAPVPEPRPATDDAAEEPEEPEEPESEADDEADGEPGGEDDASTQPEPEEPSDEAPEDSQGDGSEDDADESADRDGSGSSGRSSGDGLVGDPAGRVADPAGLRATASAAPGEGEFLAPNWVQASPPSEPSGFVVPSMVFDPVREQVVLFGGRLGTTTNLSDETWVWDGTSWTQLSPVTSPPARWRASMAWDPIGQRVVLFGGQPVTGGAMNDLWAWDGTDWSELTPSGSPPSARGSAGFAFDPLREALVLFGGTTPSGVVNDTWLFADNTWTQLQASGGWGGCAATGGGWWGWKNGSGKA